MIKKLKLKFLSVNMIIVTVMLTVIFVLIIFFTASASEKENLQQLRAALSMPPPPFRPCRRRTAVFTVSNLRNPTDATRPIGRIGKRRL